LGSSAGLAIVCTHELHSVSSTSDGEREETGEGREERKKAEKWTVEVGKRERERREGELTD